MKKIIGMIFLLAHLSIAVAATQHQGKPMQDALSQKLNTLANTFPGKVGIYLHDLQSDEVITLNADELFPMASTFKVPYLVQLFRDHDAKVLSLNDTVTLQETDFRGGFGLLKHFAPGTRLTLKDLALMMITISDNMATDIIINKVKPERVNATLETWHIQPMQMQNTIQDLFVKLEKNPNYDPLDKSMELTSPRAMGLLMEKIARCQVASQESCDDIHFILNQQILNARMPRFTSDLPQVKIAHKTGSTKWAINDVGFIQREKRPAIILCIYTLKKDPKTPSHQAEELIGKLTRQIIEHYS